MFTRSGEKTLDKTGLSLFDFAQYILTIDNVVEYLDMTSIRSLIYHVMSFYLTANIALGCIDCKLQTMLRISRYLEQIFILTKCNKI